MENIEICIFITRRDRIEVPGNSKPTANGMNHANTSHMHGNGCFMQKTVNSSDKFVPPKSKTNTQTNNTISGILFTIDLLDSITPAEENVPPSQESMQDLSAPNKDSRKPAEDKGNDHEVTYFCETCSAMPTPFGYAVTYVTSGSMANMRT